MRSNVYGLFLTLASVDKFIETVLITDSKGFSLPFTILCIFKKEFEPNRIEIEVEFFDRNKNKKFDQKLKSKFSTEDRIINQMQNS